MTKLMVAIVGAALLTGPAMGQTINNTWQYSPAGVQDQVKQAPQIGDPAQVGGTPAGNIKGAQSQLQDPRLVPAGPIILVPSRR